MWRRVKTTLRWVRRAALCALLATGAFVGLRWAGGNRGVIAGGSVVRCGQPTGEGLRAAIRRDRVRSVLNLRGPNPDAEWYRVERAVCAEQGVVHVDMALATDLHLTRAQAVALLDILDRAERPLLIHCQWGSERTGLAAAFAELLSPGGSIASARAQFSPWYLYLPTGDGRVMSGHVERYARYLAATGSTHSPDRFRRWIRAVYRPGSPSREEWPYDPYPLVTIVRPPASTMAGRPATSRR